MSTPPQVQVDPPAAEARPLPPLPKTAWLEIDLDALVSNFTVLRDALPAGVRVEPVVKADAYGHGAVEVSRALAAAGATGFNVATYDEALELRRAGIRAPILILFSIPPELAPGALRHGFSVTASDAVLLDRMLRALREAAPASRRRLSIHVEVETGLGRAGLLPGELPAALEAIAAVPAARLGGLWSHLQAAENPGRSGNQERALRAAAGLLEDRGVHLPPRHLAASGGVLASTVAPYDAVRVGLSVYGIVPDGLTAGERGTAAAAALRPVLSLRARPVRVAQLPAGTGISYGPSFVTGRDSRIATLPVGYGDGYARSLSNNAEVLVRGRRVPAVGTVAMDAIMVDVTDVPGPAITIDDEFTLIGRQGDEEIGAAEMARWRNTISYEVVTAMSRRLPRVYYAAAEAVAVRTLVQDWGGGQERSGSRGGSIAERRSEPNTKA